MGHAGASQKPPNDVPWEMLSQRLGRPFSTPFRAAALSRKQKETRDELKIMLHKLTIWTCM